MFQFLGVSLSYLKVGRYSLPQKSGLLSGVSVCVACLLLSAERFGPSLPKECIVQYLEWVVDQKKGGDVPTVLNEALGESYLSAVLELHRKTPSS